jgi:hypothetical protein
MIRWIVCQFITKLRSAMGLWWAFVPRYEGNDSLFHLLLVGIIGLTAILNSGCGGGSYSGSGGGGVEPVTNFVARFAPGLAKVGNSYQCTAVATYADGSKADVSSMVAWRSETPAILRCVGNGAFLTSAPGGGSISAKFYGLTLSIPVEVQPPSLESESASGLSERYISASSPEPTFYTRRSFTLGRTPTFACLYVAGPYSVGLFVNGQSLGTQQRSLSQIDDPNVFIFDVSSAIKPGVNQLAIEAFGGSLMLAAKLMISMPGQPPVPVLVSNSDWLVTSQEMVGWQNPQFDDSTWQNAIGGAGLEDDPTQYQGLYDTELFVWPGYDGISPFLAHETVVPCAYECYSGGGSISIAADGTLDVSVPEAGEQPHMLLDFGREINGRLSVKLNGDSPCTVAISYGESQGEAQTQPYLGARNLLLLPNGQGFGPKQGFRYALVTFLGPQGIYKFNQIVADSIYYPATWAGSFDCSDALLNQIWYVGVRTAHLTIQDWVWDGIKRDRMPWAGDLYGATRALLNSNIDPIPIQRTLAILAPHAGQEVNNISGYSAYWIMTVADLYRRTGNFQFLQNMEFPLGIAAAKLESDVDPAGLFSFPIGTQAFVDWSPDFSTDTIESRRATQFLICHALSEAAWLFSQLKNVNEAATSLASANRFRATAQQFLTTGLTFGARWQSNDLAVAMDVADPSQANAIWAILAVPPMEPITPFQNYFAVSAMAKLNHRPEAIDWIRKYWGGMLSEGTSTFWEAYDIGWDNGDIVSKLEADNRTGYYVSLCHSWSSGVSGWLQEEILGVKIDPNSPSNILIRPDLAGLASAKGDVPVATGLVHVDCSMRPTFTALIRIPTGVTATLSLPIVSGQTDLLLNGELVSSAPSEGGSRRIASVGAGTYYYQQPNSD